MRLHLLEKLRGVFHPAPHVVMKSDAFNWPLDDLGQSIPDVERRAENAERKPAEFPDDEIAAHVEKLPI